MANVKVGKHNSMLILGRAANNAGRKQIVYAERYKDVLETFGDSDLTNAYVIAKKMGAPYVFLMNCRQNYDYLDIGNTLKAADFSYIVPISLMLSDQFDNPKTERRLSYIEYLLEQVGHVNDSVFIVTDKHASLYEDVDAFISSMSEISEDFSFRHRAPAVLENIVFVANNLMNTEMANLVLASSLCTTSINRYPEADFGSAFFEIDQYENLGNWAYFQNHRVRNTTIENLLNFEITGNPLKIVFISRIVKMIKRELDFHNFIGKQYTEYRRLQVQDKLQSYLDSLVGDVLYDYTIKSVKPYRNSKEPLSVDIKTVFDIWPVNCLEKITISNKIRVA